MQNISPLPANSTIGILGGGQLARMLALSAAPLGYNICIYCPEAESPAIDVCKNNVVGAYDDETQLTKFATMVDVITYEFENIPAKTIEFLSHLKNIAPNLRSLQTSQDRMVEKQYLNSVGATTAPYANVTNHDDLDKAIQSFGLPAILKTRTMGYDGKGQVSIKTQADIQSAYDLITNNTHGDCILEGFIDFDLEISVIITRDVNNNIAIYEPSKNDHKNHILDTSTVPSQLSEALLNEACDLAKNIVSGLDYIGTMGVELFISTNTHTPIIINEIAPRVHNSGHWTQDACFVSQFEQHVRAITNLPLANTTRHSNVIMKNLIGDDILTVSQYTANPNAKIHLYGKVDVKKGRKMGHVNLLSPLK